MNREIKFRAWLPCGEWNEAGTEQAYEMVGPDALALEEYKPLADLLKNCENLMQFTGLFDKNKKPIYEGDILNTWRGTPHPDTLKIVCWHNNNRSHNGWNISKSDKFEVIGNIFESPELLKAPDRPELPL